MMRIALVSSLLLLLVACGAPVEQNSPTDALAGDFTSSTVTGQLDVLSATLQGEIGGTTFHHFADRVHTVAEEGRVEISLIVNMMGEPGMVVLNVRDPGLVGLHADAGILTCSGGTPGNWAFDQDATDVVVDVHRTGETVTLDYSGVVLDYDQFYYPDSDGWAQATPKERAEMPRTDFYGSITYLP